MSRAPIRRWSRVAVLAAAPLIAATTFPLFSVGSASAAVVQPTSASYCSANGGSFAAWLHSTPAIPICGPGPAYGGYWGYVNIPGPFGERGTYYNATPGFQCVELAERYLAVVDGLGAVKADGAQVAENYHAAYPATRLVRNGTAAAVGHTPHAGDILSFSYSPSMSGDGHVAVVIGSSVDAATGDGSVEIAQENVGSGSYVRTLDLSSWRLSDPGQGDGTEWSYPYAEWLAVPSPVSEAVRIEMKTHRATNPASRFLAPHPSTVLVSFARRP